MALGPGKYDDLAMHCLNVSHAKGVLLIVIDGDRGTGGSGKEHKTAYEVIMQQPSVLTSTLPRTLRRLAREIENAGTDAFTVHSA
jgi:hypothetical protein